MFHFSLRHPVQAIPVHATAEGGSRSQWEHKHKDVPPGNLKTNYLEIKQEKYRATIKQNSCKQVESTIVGGNYPKSIQIRCCKLLAVEVTKIT